METYFLLHEQKKGDPDWIVGLNKSGYAGCTRQGWIVDRRQFPDAVPVQRSSVFGNAEPKEVTKEQRFELIKMGVTFPMDEEENDLWDETFKDYPFELDEKSIDPQKLLDHTNKQFFSEL